MKLNGVESQFLVCLELAGILRLLAHRRPEGIGTGADVPGAKRKPILGLAAVGGRSHEMLFSSIGLTGRRGSPPLAAWGPGWVVLIAGMEVNAIGRPRTPHSSPTRGVTSMTIRPSSL